MSRRESERSAFGEVITRGSELWNNRASWAQAGKTDGTEETGFVVRLQLCNKKSREGERYKLQEGNRAERRRRKCEHKRAEQKAKRQGPGREEEVWLERRVLIGPWARGHAATTSKVRYTSIAAGKG